MDRAHGQPSPSGVPGGATVSPEYMGRSMKTYPVYETEMEMIGAYNGQATAFFTAGGIVFGYAVSIWINAAFYSTLTAMGSLATQVLAPFLVLVAAFLVAVGLAAWLRKRNLWTRIMRESTPMAVEMGAKAIAVTGPTRAR